MTKLWAPQASKPWQQKRHGLFPRSSTPRVVTVLPLHQRQEQYAQEGVEEQGQAPVTQQRRHLLLMVHVRLTKDIWLKTVVPFLAEDGGTVPATHLISVKHRLP